MNVLKQAGKHLLVAAEIVGLMCIAILTVIAMGQEMVGIYHIQKVSLGDLLLLFIYLEVLAMVGLYLKSGRFPVRMPLYIVIVAIARYMALDMKNLDMTTLLGLSGAILMIAVAILIIRFGHVRFPYGSHDD
ncbi:phosphate-starvation-inducible protein PsiE [Vibrio palustris]|uniref:Protein PsiE n=1 Tax=Vibrio palustris TaxID=1918946 RepID=A0A1R4B4J9_9VIBR|nr:phosphate-starvation-inducible PsiE family protein [Vibrio palustris]SJL83829.1 phosphate-starvation-inducible protein PsiE [Vibrio palustris]